MSYDQYLRYIHGYNGKYHENQIGNVLIVKCKGQYGDVHNYESILIADDTHPKGRYRKLVHRVIMQHILGRKLKRCEVIRHLDGNTLNNKPTNLSLVNEYHKFEMSDFVDKPLKQLARERGVTLMHVEWERMKYGKKISEMRIDKFKEMGIVEDYKTMTQKAICKKYGATKGYVRRLKKKLLC